MSPKLLNLLLLMASGAMYYLLIGPLYTGESTGVWAPEKSIQALIQEKKDLEKTIEGVRPLITEANALKTLYDGIDADTRARLSIMVPDSIDEIKLYAELTRIAAEAGFPVELGGKDRGNGEFAVSLVVLTNYEGFKRFISFYEKSLRLYTLDSAVFSPSPKDEETKFTVSLVTYYLNPKAK